MDIASIKVAEKTVVIVEIEIIHDVIVAETVETTNAATIVEIAEKLLIIIIATEERTVESALPDHHTNNNLKHHEMIIEEGITVEIVNSVVDTIESSCTFSI